MTLDQHYQRYLTHPDHQDALLGAVTRAAQHQALCYRHPDPEMFAQDFFIDLWKHWPLNVRKSFGGLIRKLIRNKLARDWHKRQRSVPIESPREEEDTTDLIERKAVTVSGDYRDLTTITDDRKRKIAAMLLMGYTKQEAANAIGCSMRTIERMVA